MQIPIEGREGKEGGRNGCRIPDFHWHKCSRDLFQQPQNRLYVDVFFAVVENELHTTSSNLSEP